MILLWLLFVLRHVCRLLGFGRASLRLLRLVIQSHQSKVSKKKYATDEFTWVHSGFTLSPSSFHQCNQILGVTFRGSTKRRPCPLNKLPTAANAAEDDGN